MSVWDVVIVGASLAGVSAARELRADDDTATVLVIGAEEHLPYDRPPLSKEFLEHPGEDHPEPDPLLGEEDDLGAQWRLGVRAVALRPGAPHEIELDDGTTVFAKSVIIATGAGARRLEGVSVPGVHVLRTLDDARELREGLRTAKRVVIIGAGFVGAEVASVARAKGLEVTVLDATDEPLAPVLGSTVAARCRAEHERNGAHLRTGAAVAGIDGDAHVEAVRLADGTVLPADLVVVGIGAVPEVAWLRDSGLDIDLGVLVDHDGRTSVPGVWAAGDCAQTWDERLGRHLRTEHWTHATTQARAVARSLLGLDSEPVPPPYVWSHQYGHWIQLAGHPHPDDQITVLEGDLDDGPVVVRYDRDGETVAVLAIDSPRRFTRLRKALQRGLPIE